MALRAYIILVAALAVACVGDSNQTGDAGNDAAVDAAPDVKSDAGPTTCVFGTSHFDDGCTLGATYCGGTGNTNAGLAQLTGSQTSYAKTRAACATACSSPTAHMCIGAELVRSAALGQTVASGWYSSGAHTGSDSECAGW